MDARCQSPSSPALHHTGATSHASPATEDGGILGRVVEKIEDGSHHSLLASAEAGERLEAHRVTLSRVVIDGVRPTVAFKHTVKALGGALAEGGADEVDQFVRQDERAVIVALDVA